MAIERMTVVRVGVTVTVLAKVMSKVTVDGIVLRTPRRYLI